MIKDENPNAPHTIFVTFQLSGTEADKELVGDDGSGGNGGSTEEPNLPEVEVDSKVIETVLDEPGRPKWTERMPIKPATVTSLDKDAEMQTTIEGLPKGLKFDGRTITGTPVVEDDNWDGDNGMFKTVTLKFKAKKNGVMLVRKYKYWIYRDKDRDGIADDDEDGGTAFTPQRHNSKPLVVDGKEPTLDDYKALFSNIPADGSVKVSIKQKPDLSKKGTARAVLEFSVDGVKKNGRAIVIIDVKNPVEESANAAVSSSTRNATTAAIASSSTRESSSVESVGQPKNGNVNKKENIQKPTESKETTESSSVESVGQPENDNVNKKEDIQKPTESSAAAEAERMVQ